jgi:hypothetical protein
MPQLGNFNSILANNASSTPIGVTIAPQATSAKDPIFEIISNEQINKIQTYQSEANSILKDEKERLALKKASMDADADNAERMILLNQTHRDRQHQYLVIMVLFLIVFGICLGIVVFQNKLGYSSIFMDVLIVFVVGSGMVTAFFMMGDIFTRDPIDFSKVGQPGGNLLDVSKLAAATQASIDAATIAGGSTVCVGEVCCNTTSQKWDPTLLRCVNK